jgi:hypothetical protein
MTAENVENGTAGFFVKAYAEEPFLGGKGFPAAPLILKKLGYFNNFIG